MVSVSYCVFQICHVSSTCSIGKLSGGMIWNLKLTSSLAFQMEANNLVWNFYKLKSYNGRAYSINVVHFTTIDVFCELHYVLLFLHLLVSWFAVQQKTIHHSAHYDKLSVYIIIMCHKHWTSPRTHWWATFSLNAWLLYCVHLFHNFGECNMSCPWNF